MKKIDETVGQAVAEFQSGNQGNTDVRVDTYHHDSNHISYEARVYLYGNLIATRNATMESDSGRFTVDTVVLDHAGWKTPTTKARMNGICDALGILHVYQRQGDFYQGGMLMEPCIQWSYCSGEWKFSTV